MYLYQDSKELVMNERWVWRARLGQSVFPCIWFGNSRKVQTFAPANFPIVYEDWRLPSHVNVCCGRLASRKVLTLASKLY